MKALIRFKCLMGLVMSMILAGCATSSATTPYCIIMKTPDLFIVNNHEVDGSDLIKALKKADIPQYEPLIIQLPPNTSFMAVKQLTQRLVSAGYKPFFKNPRHANVSVDGKRVPSKP